MLIINVQIIFLFVFLKHVKTGHLMYSSLYTDSRYVDMAKSSLLMRAATSGGGSSRLMMVLLRSFSSAWGSKTQHEPILEDVGDDCVSVRMSASSPTGVTVSFFSAELYCSSERKGSPLGKVSSGDLVAISQTPSYHSSGHRPWKVNRREMWRETQRDVRKRFQLTAKKNLNAPEPSTAKPMTTE